MNAPIPRIPRLADFPYRLDDNIRFADLDPNQHVNNTAYAVYFETARVMLMRDPARGLMPPGAAWVLVRLDTHFRSELHWPGRIHIGLGVERLGRTSVTFTQGVFSEEGICAASATAVIVMVDRASRKPMPLSDAVVATLTPLLLPSPR